MTELNPVVEKITNRIIQRSKSTRNTYLKAVNQMFDSADSDRQLIGCSNLAHAAAGACGDKSQILGDPHSRGVNIGIVTAYNDMLSAHQPYADYPDKIKKIARSLGATAQVAGGVPAMCDGVTQGRPGMELSLASRDVIAMATAVALSHNVFDAALCLGVCDKIVPGMLIGALAFGHLPVIFIPAGPMESGISNAEKASVRKQYAKGEIDRSSLLASESAAYHSPGTCTFYGTANSNQMLMEIMGLQIPCSSFINPKDPLRDLLIRDSVEKSLELIGNQSEPLSIGKLIDARSIVNGIVGLHATGGSTNHTLHLVSMAAAAGYCLTWSDISELSAVTPLITRVYPNGKADINDFQNAGGMGVLISELLDAGLVDGTALSVTGRCLSQSVLTPRIKTDGSLDWDPVNTSSVDNSIIRSVKNPFSTTGGLVHLRGNLGDAVIKVSAVPSDRKRVCAKARVFEDELSVKIAFESGELSRDVVVIVRGQGPRANGMPELHGLTPVLSVLQDQGFKVALVTDGRMSGASGSVPAAIHVCPEAVSGGMLARVIDGDEVLIDAEQGILSLNVDEETLLARTLWKRPHAQDPAAWGRSLFKTIRDSSLSAMAGGGISLSERSG